MRSVGKLQAEIENARRKLDDAIRNGYNEEECYDLSVALDKLIERYIALEETIPMA